MGGWAGGCMTVVTFVTTSFLSIVGYHTVRNPPLLPVLDKCAVFCRCRQSRRVITLIYWTYTGLHQDCRSLPFNCLYLSPRIHLSFSLVENLAPCNNNINIPRTFYTFNSLLMQLPFINRSFFCKQNCLFPIKIKLKLGWSVLLVTCSELVCDTNT